jgi:hypothetical protein
VSARIRLPLHPEATQEEVDSMAYMADWTLAEIITKNRERPHEQVYEDRKDGTPIHYIRDWLLGVDYLVVPAQAPQTARIRKELHVVSLKEALAMVEAAETPEALRRAFFFAVLASPAPNPRVLALFERLLASSEIKLRRAAVLAAGYAEWRELRPLLARAATEDRRKQVREEARLMLEGLEQVWAGT